MFTTASNATTQAYPLYDTHGNMVATLSKNTAGTSWSLGNERSYDVWGSVRSGAVTGGPKGRYVANLGHVADDESGLIYMRARYYEPETGRFVSEDIARAGHNWYVYCSNIPISRVDLNGCDWQEDAMMGVGALAYSAGSMMAVFAICMFADHTAAGVIAAIEFSAMAVLLIGIGAGCFDCASTNGNGRIEFVVTIGTLALEATFAWAIKQVTVMAAGAKAGIHTYAYGAVAACFAYNLLCLGWMASMQFEESE